jgi:hypothetical protein
MNCKYQAAEKLKVEVTRDTFSITHIRGPFEKFVDWQHCAAVTQRKAVTVMSSCIGADNVVVA